MSLYRYISKRKSTRKYDMTPLEKEVLDQVLHFADNLKPLYPDIHTVYELTDDVKNILPVKSPHYFIISSEDSDGYLENIGFMFQQMDLYLSSLGLGSCWLGMARPSQEPETELPFVIILAFGNPLESPYRELAEFKRKPLSEISSGVDKRLEAAHMAPSASNTQNWFFEATNDKIDAYQKVSLIGRLYHKMNKIDMGIALCHLYLATEHFGKEFVFSKEVKTEKKGYLYIGTVQ